MCSVHTCAGLIYIYLDSIEDAGVDWVNKLLEKTLEQVESSSDVASAQQSHAVNVDKGDFWITLDPFQGLQDTHSLHRGIGNQLQWKGNLVDNNLLVRGFTDKKFVKLEQCFRMPQAIINYIDSEKVLPVENFPRAQEVESQGVIQENLALPSGFSFQWLADQVAEQLNTRVMRRGIHPGHCAVLFDQGAVDQLFPPSDGGLPEFVKLVNQKLNGMTTNVQTGCMLQVSQDTRETLLYSRSQRNTSSALVAEILPAGIVNTAPEETAVYQTERHAEVIMTKDPHYNKII